MYVLEYCNDPEKGNLVSSGESFSDDFGIDYELHLDALNRFMYLMDMFRICKSCSEDLISLPDGEEVAFWLVNKYLLNYLNAVYSYKEYINSYDPPLKTITDGYYYNRKWYRFICDYRNRVIHQSTIIKDRSPKNGDVFINLDEIISIQNEIIADFSAKNNNKEQKKIQSQIDNAKRFKRELETFIPDASLTIGGIRYQSMKSIVKEAQQEITAMNDEILLYALKSGVLPAIDWFLDLTYIQDGKYMYTFIVRKLTQDCWEPNYSIESFCQYAMQSVGQSSPVLIELYNHLNSRGYLFSYEGKCSIENFLGIQPQVYC